MSALREREFAQLYADHDRLLAERGALDTGDLVLRAFALLHEHPHVRSRVAGGLAAVLADDYQDANFAQAALLALLCEEARAGHRDRRRAAPRAGRVRARASRSATTVALERSMRCPRAIATAARAAAGRPTRRGARGRQRALLALRLRARPGTGRRGRRGGLIAAGTDPDRVAVLMPSAVRDGAVVCAALEERALPFRLHGSAAYFQRAEVRDLLAWLRLLANPADSGAAVRVMARPPVGLHSVDIARLTQLARRRKLDMPSAVAAALEGPQLTPEGRDRAQYFLRLYRPACAAFEDRRPDAFVLRLIERVGIRRQQVFATQADTVERLRNIAVMPELATAFMRREPGATPRDFARYLRAVADSGLEWEEVPAPEREEAVQVLDIDAARGREFDHVFVAGPDAPPRLRRPRAPRERWPASRAPPEPGAVLGRAHRTASRGEPVERRPGGAVGARGDDGGGAVRPRRGTALHVPDHARRTAGHRCPGGRPAGRDAPGRGGRRGPRRGPFPGAGEGGRADRPLGRRARRWSRRCRR